MAISGRYSAATSPGVAPVSAEGGGILIGGGRIIALLLLALMGWLMFSGALEDAVTYDEQPHVAAGYTYLTRQSLDFNVEHPPLIKDLASLPLLFMKLDLSWDTPDWYNGDPWEFGRKLLDHSNDDPDGTMLAVRVPMMALTLALGWLLFAWTRSRFGDAAAVIALLLYVFSPTMLAHGRLVTTDVGAAAGFFIALTAFLRFLESPTAKHVLLAGLALGLALLTKFSTFLLVPVFIVLAVSWWWLHRVSATADNNAPPSSAPRSSWRSPIRWTRGRLLIALPNFARQSREPTMISQVTAPKVAAVILLGFACMYFVYAHHIRNLPQERQMERTKISLTGRGVGNTPKNAVMWMARHTALRPLAAYFSGMFQTMIRSAQGGGVYLLGTFYPQGVRQYFPLVYLMKEPASLHVLTMLALISLFIGVFLKGGPLFCWHWDLGRRTRISWIKESFRAKFVSFSFLLVIIVYWIFSVRSNLNIGVRHLLPIFPITFAWVAHEVYELTSRLPMLLKLNDDFRLRAGMLMMVCMAFIALLLAWQTASVLRAQPYHMAYFNEFAGGPENGWRRVIDSNADWGQDMGRLAKFVEQHGITKLSLDYFGSADANRYLPGKWEAINGCSEPRKGWVAVSVMFYQNSAGNPACDYRRWLPLDRLAAKVGYSTLLFDVK